MVLTVPDDATPGTQLQDGAERPAGDGDGALEGHAGAGPAEVPAAPAAPAAEKMVLTVPRTPRRALSCR